MGVAAAYGQCLQAQDGQNSKYTAPEAMAAAAVVANKVDKVADRGHMLEGLYV